MHARAHASRKCEHRPIQASWGWSGPYFGPFRRATQARMRRFNCGTVQQKSLPFQLHAFQSDKKTHCGELPKQTPAGLPDMYPQRCRRETLGPRATGATRCNSGPRRAPAMALRRATRARAWRQARPPCARREHAPAWHRARSTSPNSARAMLCDDVHARHILCYHCACVGALIAAAAAATAVLMSVDVVVAAAVCRCGRVGRFGRCGRCCCCCCCGCCRCCCCRCRAGPSLKVDPRIEIDTG